MPAPVVAAAGASGGAGGAAGGAGGGAAGGGSMAQFGKGGQMLGKQGMSKKDLAEQAQQQSPDLDSARGEMKQPDMQNQGLGKTLMDQSISMAKKPMKMISKQPAIGGMG